MPSLPSLQQEQVKRDATVYQPTRPCKPDGDGGTLCGIPVGYRGTGRTGVYYLPKVGDPSCHFPLPLWHILLSSWHGAIRRFPGCGEMMFSQLGNNNSSFQEHWPLSSVYYLPKVGFRDQPILHPRIARRWGNVYMAVLYCCRPPRCTAMLLSVGLGATAEHSIA